MPDTRRGETTLLADNVIAEAELRAPQAAGASGKQASRAARPWYLRALFWAGGFAAALLLCWQLGGGNVHNDFTQNVWLPARLVLDGANPYFPTRTEVDGALGPYGAQFSSFNSGQSYHFIYPMWAALAFTPFAALPIELATAIWRALNLLLLVWAAAALLRASGPAYRSGRPAALAALSLAVFLCLFYRESFLTLYIGQFSIIELALLVAVWLRLGAASEQTTPGVMPGGAALLGLSLAVMLTKPQALGLVVALVLLWSARRGNWAIPLSAVAWVAALLILPLFAFPGSVGDWLNIVFGRGQASSQAQVSASVWGISYQWLGVNGAATAVALVLTGAGLALLFPRWLGDLRDKTSPAPLSLPLTLCVNSVVSPYMLGYEHVLLLFPAMLLLAWAGLPGGEAAATPGATAGEQSKKQMRFAMYAWLGVLPLLVVSVQAVLEKEYPAIAQSAAMLAICMATRFSWRYADAPRTVRVA